MGMNIRRTRAIWMVAALLLAIGPVATWLGSSAAAQGGNHLSGTVYDPDGKPYANVTLVFTNTETHRVFTVTTDAKGRYTTPDMDSGTWNIDVKDQTGTIVFRDGGESQRRPGVSPRTSRSSSPSSKNSSKPSKRNSRG